MERLQQTTSHTKTANVAANGSTSAPLNTGGFGQEDATNKKQPYVSHQPDSHGHIQYGDHENAMWQALLERQASEIPNRACSDYIEGLKKLNLPATHIPQLSDIDEVLQASTGWQTAAVPALISFGKFFKLLANKSFPVATFIRRFEDMDYIEEPDIFHEIVGHCPLLTHPAFATFNETYGKLGLEATKEERWFLARLYWFTIEFGLLGVAVRIAESTAAAFSAHRLRLSTRLVVSCKTRHCPVQSVEPLTCWMCYVHRIVSIRFSRFTMLLMIWIHSLISLTVTSWAWSKRPCHWDCLSQVIR